jgi:hypothetical protein
MLVTFLVRKVIQDFKLKMRIQYFPAQSVDQEVTGNCKERGCEDVGWIGVAVDRIGSGFCKHCKEASSSTTGRQNIQIFQNDTDVSGCQ